MKKRIAVGLATVGLISTLIGGATFSIFTDSATNSGNTFKAGKIDINSQVAQEWTVGCDNMAPGDVKVEKLTVSNDGTLELRYDVSADIQGALFGGANPTQVKFLKDGEEFTPGDNNFVLAPGESDEITVEVTMPKDAGNEYQEATGSIDINFAAEQTANN